MHDLAFCAWDRGYRSGLKPPDFLLGGLKMPKARARCSCQTPLISTCQRKFPRIHVYSLRDSQTRSRSAVLIASVPKQTRGITTETVSCSTASNSGGPLGGPHAAKAPDRLMSSLSVGRLPRMFLPQHGLSGAIMHEVDIRVQYRFCSECGIQPSR